MATTKYESIDIENTDGPFLSYEEKNRLLFLRQKKTLDMFLEKGAISQTQHDKSLHDLIEKMGMQEEQEREKKHIKNTDHE